MATAPESAATFYGGFFAVLGSVLVLFGFVTTGMKKAWPRVMGATGAMCLAVSAAVGLNSEFSAYSHAHVVQAALAGGVLVGVTVFALRSFFRAKRAGKKATTADEEQGAAVDPREPSREGGAERGDHVSEDEHGERQGDPYFIDLPEPRSSTGEKR